MNKKLVSLVLSGLIVLNNASCITSVHANENKKSDKLIENQNTKSKKIVYLTGGEGNRNTGDGTQQNPYQNIRTALENIQDGETLKIVGTVIYTKYVPHTDGSALPLFINKNITIEGGSGKSPLDYDADGLVLRAPIQLGANVTFKNLRLEMTSQVSLGRNVNKLNERLLGQKIPRSATIFTAGHELTLDNINTRVGSSPDQYDDRPYISGGSYKDKGTIGTKSIINIKNPNNETIISGIYAGDYWKDRNLDVEINLDGKLVDTTIYTGGIEGSLTGDIVVNLGRKSNVTKFDKKNHNGTLDVNLKKDFFSAMLDFKGVNNLTLEEDSRVTLPEHATFDVNNVTLKNDAVIDFRDMKKSPVVRGNFKGEENIDDTRKGGAILLNNEQTLNIEGELTGTTRLNNNRPESVKRFKEDHEYVRAKASSKGELSIEDTIYDNFKLIKNTDNNHVSWIAFRVKQAFGDFRFVGGDYKIINPQNGKEYAFPIEFIDDQDKPYNPDVVDLHNDFKYTITKPDGTILDIGTSEWHIDFGLYQSEDINELDRLGLYFFHQEELNGEMVVTATHKATGKSISKNIYIVRDSDKLTGTVDIIGNAVEGRTISADTSNLISGAKELTYKWYVDGSEVTGQTDKDFVITKEHVGKKIKVEVEAKNYLGTIFSSEITVKSSDVVPVIKGADDIEIKASEVDKFNNNNLYGITVTDDDKEGLVTTVTGIVKKPAAGENKTFEITYSAKDKDGNTTEVVRRVTVTNQVPAISGLEEIFMIEGETPDIKTGVMANDKEDGNITENIVYPTIDQSKLKLGRNEIEYQITDKDGNTTKAKRGLIVVEKTSSIGPTISGTDDIALKVGEVDDFNKNRKTETITITDDIDPVVIPRVIGEVGKPLAGTNETYELIYEAIDSDGNKTEARRKVTVTNQLPKISGLSEITITSGQTADIENGVKASDHEDGDITKDIVYPSIDLTTLSAGTHKIEYSVKDSDGNITKAERTVKVLSSDAPKILGVKDIELKVSQVDEFNKNHKLTGITVTDDIDKNLVPKVTGEVGKPKAGTNETYKLVYSVTDKDGNKTEVERKVTVTNQLPEISGLTDIVIRKWQTVDIKAGVKANDKEDGDITKNIVYPSTDLTTLSAGTHKIEYSVKDSDGNITKAERTVKILSSDAPKILGVSDIELKVSQVDEFNNNHKLTGITVNDDIDKDLVATVTGEVGKPSAGTNETYKLIYSVTDSDGNKTEVERKVTVTNQLPVISGLSEIVITEGQTAEIKAGVKASDKEDGDITKNIVYPSADLTTLPVGQHEIEYEVTDSDGNTTKFKRVVTILEDKSSIDDKPPIEDNVNQEDNINQEQDKEDSTEQENTDNNDVNDSNSSNNSESLVDNTTTNNNSNSNDSNKPEELNNSDESTESIDSDELSDSNELEELDESIESDEINEQNSSNNIKSENESSSNTKNATIAKVAGAVGATGAVGIAGAAGISKASSAGLLKRFRFRIRK